jgi:4-amino-4-deoxy-L-arabinose transferase-like glycosyltransferase
MNGGALSHLVRVALLALLPIVAGLPGVNGLALYRGDEKFYIQWGQEMLGTGNLLVPVYDGHLHLPKPPLYYWLTALSFHWFGLSLFAARLPSLLAASASVALTYWLTLRLYRNERCALYAGCALASSYVVFWSSRLALTDMVMSFGVLVAMAFYVQGVLGERRRTSFFLASLGVGIAGMAKGHVGVVVALVPLASFTALSWRKGGPAIWRDLLVPSTWVPALILCGWWYAFLLASERPAADFAPLHRPSGQTLRAAFLEFFRAEEIAGRGSGGLKGLVSNLGYYPLAFVRSFLPWNLCVVAGFFLGKRHLRNDWEERRLETLALAVWIVSIPILFTVGIRQQARTHYLLPIAPAVAILAARYLIKRELDLGTTARRFVPVVAALALLVSYNVVFAGALPAVQRQPLQRLCEVLKPQLVVGDEVWVAGIDSKWHVFAMAMLGQKVEFLGSQSAGQRLKERIDALPELTHPYERLPIYVVTTDETWRALSEPERSKFRILHEAVGVMKRVKPRDVWVRPQPGQPLPRRWQRLLLLEYAPKTIPIAKT